MGCQSPAEKKGNKVKDAAKKQVKIITPKKEKKIYLNDDNAIPFFYEYAKKNKEDKVRIVTKYGNIDIKLYENTPYHRANFIYLTKKNTSMEQCFIGWSLILSFRGVIPTVGRVCEKGKKLEDTYFHRIPEKDMLITEGSFPCRVAKSTTHTNWPPPMSSL